MKIPPIVTKKTFGIPNWILVGGAVIGYFILTDKYSFQGSVSPSPSPSPTLIQTPMKIINAGINRQSNRYAGPFVTLSSAPLAQKFGEGYGVAWFTDRGVYTAVSHFAMDSHSQLAPDDNTYHGHVTFMDQTGRCVNKFSPTGHAQILNKNTVILLHPEITKVNRVMTFYATQKPDKRFCIDKIFDDISIPGQNVLRSDRQPQPLPGVPLPVVARFKPY